jgi:hypothetical protein
LAALVDVWWIGVEQDLEYAGLSPGWQVWAKEYLLPRVYWAHYVAHTRCAWRKAKLCQALEASQTAFDRHVFTRRLPLQALEEWQAWARQRVRAFQRASSTVEGRNGALAQMHHNQRGLPRQRHKVRTVLHNFDCRALDGTTPAARFFGRQFPDLFEAAFPHMTTLPRPRQRQRERWMQSVMLCTVPLYADTPKKQGAWQESAVVCGAIDLDAKLYWVEIVITRTQPSNLVVEFNGVSLEGIRLH